MAGHIYELALERAIEYLAGRGIEMTPESLERILALIKQASRQGEVGLLRRVMNELPHHFDVGMPPVYSAAPPIHRKSMGYD